MAPAEVEYYNDGKIVETCQVGRKIKRGRETWIIGSATLNITSSKGEYRHIGRVEDHEDGAKLVFTIPAEINGQEKEFAPSRIIKAPAKIIFRHPEDKTSFTVVKVTKRRQPQSRR